MRQRDPNWLREILDDAAEKVKDKPDWLRSPELRAELRRVEEQQRAARAESASSGPRDPQSST